jgi:hypothetical protein
MHPMLMMSLADEMERDRRNERQKLALRSSAFGVRGRGFRSLRPASGLVGRLVVGSSPRPRIS